MEAIPFILFGIAVLAISIWLVVRSRKPATIEQRIAAIKKVTVTANGLNIKIEKGAKCPPSDIDAMERGLTRCFEKARAVGYDTPFNLSAYTIVILGDAMRAPESQTLCYKLPAGPYAGTQWDLGGFILAAGQCVYIGGATGNVIAIPEHNGQDLEQLALISEYEAEHVILFYCDPAKFEATKVHGQGQGHPLFS